MAIGTLPPELFAEQQQLNRQQQLATMLMQQGQQQPQGQMVSGRFVPTSFFQNIAPVFAGYMGNRLAEQGDKKALDIAARLRAGESQAMVDFNKIRQGTPAVEGGIYGADNKLTMQTTPDMFDANMQLNPQFRQVAPTAAVAPNPQAAFEKLYSDPRATQRLRDLAFNKMTADPEAITLSEGQIRSVRNPDGTFKEVARGGEKLTETERNFKKAQSEGYQGTFFQYQADLKKFGATNINMPNESERKAGFMSSILDRNIAQMQKALNIDPSAVKPNVPASIVTAIAGENVLSRSITPAQRQIIEDSQLDILDAALTLRTGAAYTREQLVGMRNTYFPRLGDPQETIEAKQARLETLLDSAFIAAGRATPNRVSSPPTNVPAVKNTFANQAEADKAMADGKLKKGDKITVNGVRGTIQ